MEVKQIYEQSSGVNIDLAHSQYDEERAIGYDGEFALFKCLLNNDDFEHSKLLTNLVIPNTTGNSTTEIDMLLITQYGIIVFEVKNYTGTIYGNINDKYWTQYFRTVSNNRFNNPLKQNEYHIQALKKLCPQKMYSVIFFSNPECDTRRILIDNCDSAVTNPETLGNILFQISSRPQVISVDEINLIFENLKKYTNATASSKIYADSKTNSFDTFLKHSKAYMDSQIKETETNCKKDFEARTKTIISVAVLITILVTILCFSFIHKAHNNVIDATNSRDNAITLRDEALVKYNDMYTKFSIVSEEDIELSQSLLSISNVTIKPHDYLDGSSLSFVIENTSQTAHIAAKSNKAKILVTLKDGSVQEYSLNQVFMISPGNQSTYTLALSCKQNEIQYIKMETLYIISNGKYTHPFSLNIYIE